MGGIVTDFQRMIIDIGGWIYNTIKDIKNYFCQTVKNYFVNISKLRTIAYISGIAVSGLSLPLLVPTAAIDILAKLFGSSTRIFSLLLEKIYLSIIMIFGEQETFDINNISFEEGEEENLINQHNQNNQNIEVHINEGNNGIIQNNQNNKEQDVSENQPINPNLENEHNEHRLDMTQDFISAIEGSIRTIREFHFLDPRTYSFSFTLNPNNANEIINNNENNEENILRNSMVSRIAFSYSEPQNSIHLGLNNGYAEYCNLEDLKMILGRIIENLKSEGYNPLIMEDLNDGFGERPVNLEDLEDVEIIKMLIPINRNPN